MVPQLHDPPAGRLALCYAIGDVSRYHDRCHANCVIFDAGTPEVLRLIAKAPFAKPTRVRAMVYEYRYAYEEPIDEAKYASRLFHFVKVQARSKSFPW